MSICWTTAEVIPLNLATSIKAFVHQQDKHLQGLIWQITTNINFSMKMHLAIAAVKDSSSLVSVQAKKLWQKIFDRNISNSLVWMWLYLIYFGFRSTLVAARKTDFNGIGSVSFEKWREL